MHLPSFSQLALVLLIFFSITEVSSNTSDSFSNDQLLDLDLETLMDIKVVSATKKPKRIDRVASAVYVITQDDIRRSGVTSIPEALRMAPGVHVARVGTDKWAISIRGFNGRFANKLQILMDGRSVYSPIFSGVIWGQQDTLIEDIDRIEVIRGPGTTLWGANAMNGVINIITKKAIDTQGTLLTAGGGSFEQGFVGARYGGKLGQNTPFRIYVKGFSRDNTRSVTGSNAQDDWESGRTGFRIEHTHNNDTYTLQGDLFANKIGGIVQQSTLTPPFSRVARTNGEESGGNIRFRWERELSEESSITLQAYYDRIQLKFGNNNIDFADSFDLDFNYQVPLFERHHTTWGTNFRLYNNRIIPSETTGFNPAQAVNYFIAGYVRDEITLLPEQLWLTLGSRFSYNNFTGFEAQPDARLLWSIDANNSVWAAVSRAVRLPSRGERHGFSNLGAIDLLNGSASIGLPLLTSLQRSRNFGSEKLIAYELGYRHQFSPRLSIDTTAFYNDYTNLRNFTIGVPTLGSTPVPHLAIPIMFDNSASANSFGVEVSTDWQPYDKWRMQGSYSYLNFHDIKSSDFPDATSTGLKNANPRHIFSLRSNYSLTERLELNLWLRYVSSLSFNDIKDYVTMDAKLAWKPIKNVEFSIVGQNLFRQNHREGTSDFFLSQNVTIPRGIYFGARWGF